jgi:hypothetical protein
MLRKAGEYFVIAVVVVTLWKLFGGDPVAAFSSVYDLVSGWVGSLSDWLLEQPFLHKLLNA